MTEHQIKSCAGCPGKGGLVKKLVTVASRQVTNGKKVNLVWLEATGCSGNIISFLNALDPDVGELLKNRINLCFNNSLMTLDGERAMEQLFATAEEGNFILAVEGAVATEAGGLYNVLGRYRGEKITALKAVQYLGERASHVIAVGTCASYGGPSAARPNPSRSLSVVEVLKNREVIRLPGCPCHPDWFIGTLAHILIYGTPALDDQRRPLLFYGVTIHDNCTRRSFFDQGIFATKLGEETCMFLLGCRGPITKTDCPTRKWNGYLNWPVGANTPCIGCAHPTFPDGTEPFVDYERGR
ncbi:MAG: hydrogenase small subunit [Desulfitobacteriaceae bacterium]|nr:hydrogenase small subunit [Desulfitobacteriaceae bacterium]MDD4752852.1 hydrogenase small subunit [Desulfitobacteriaceae bacterium]